MHWPDLYKFLLKPDEDFNSLTDARRRKLIEENPGKVDAFFMERGDAFITEVYQVNLYFSAACSNLNLIF